MSNEHRCTSACTPLMCAPSDFTPRRVAEAATSEQYLKALARIAALVEALEKISAIENEMHGGDWDEINQARAIARAALAQARAEQAEPLTDDEIWKFWCNRPEVAEGEDDSMEAEFVAACRAAIAAHNAKLGNK